MIRLQLRRSLKTPFTKATLIVLSLVIGVAVAIPLVPRNQAAALEPWQTDGWSTISVGGSQACGISDGQAYCWGHNDFGELGNNSTTDSSVPVAVDTSGVLSGKTILSISAGSQDVCAIASDNQAYCWGLNNAGQLGNNSTTDSSVPVAVDTSGVLNGKTILSISSGEESSCVVASDHQAYCWGQDSYGELGDNNVFYSSVPVAVDTSGVLSGKTIQSVSIGGVVACAIASDQEAYCWGHNGFGELGNNSTTNSGVPVAVDTSGVLSGKTIQSISAGGESVCAIASDNQAYCWGRGNFGVLGNNSTLDSPVAVAVNTSGLLSGKTIQSMTMVGSDVCVVASDSQGYCWGLGNFGQLGNNDSTSSSVPVAVDTSGVLSGKTILSISTGGQSACVIASDSQGYCWGQNNYDQLGNDDPTYTSSYVPVLVRIRGAPTITSVSFSTQSGHEVIIINGTDFPDYNNWVSGSLVSLNGVQLPFCAEPTGIPASSLPPGSASDTPPCYLLVDSSFTPTFTSTQATIWLADGFDITAPGTVSVTGSNTFAFNAPSTPPDNTPPATPPSTPPTDNTSQPSTHTSVATTTDTTSQPVAITVQANNESLGGGATTTIPSLPTFTGTAEPYSTVTVTVHSDPVICTTTADSTGHWSCTLSEDLPAGTHHVLIKVVAPDNTTTELGPYDVVVVAHTPTVIDSQNKLTPSATTSFPWIWVGAGVLGLIVIIVIIAVVRRRKAI